MIDEYKIHKDWSQYNFGQYLRISKPNQYYVVYWKSFRLWISVAGGLGFQ